MLPRIRQWALAVAAACAASACGDQPTDPTVASTAPATLSRTEEVVGLLKRTEPLPDGLSASAVIGPRGGQLFIPRAGLRLDFPSGAVTVPTRITVTALGGRNVAYRFEPHGLVFKLPVSLEQNLRNTEAWKSPLADAVQGSYFERLLVDRTESFAKSLERRGGKLKNSRGFLEFTIEHFSGYMVSTGKGPIDIEVDIDITSR
jgi:hypothetical protein